MPLNMSQVPFIDIAVQDTVREAMLDGKAAILFDAAVEQVYWANGAAASLFGFASISDFQAAGIAPFQTTIRQLKSAAARRPQQAQSLLLRVTAGLISQLAKAEIQILKIDKNIGRSIRYNAKEDWFSYSKGDDKTQTVWAFDANSKQTNELISLPPRSQYYTWLNSHTLLSSKANQLVTWNINSEKEWETLADVSSICSTGISRIAVNKDQSKLALVCNEATSK